MKSAPVFETRLARSEGEILAGQALRYRVFVEELGADGGMVCHDARLERDEFDAHAQQLLLLDRMRPDGDQVVGVYRILDSAGAQAAGRFYSEGEYDLDVLRRSGRVLMELGRSCLHADYRGGAALMHLWKGLAQIVREEGAEVLFGVASFHGTDVAALAQPLSLLARDHLAPPELRVKSAIYQDMALCDEIERLSAMKQVPSLIKAYLRMGGFVGDGAFVDHAFNTTDVCLVLDLARLNQRQAALYGAKT